MRNKVIEYKHVEVATLQGPRYLSVAIVQTRHPDGWPGDDEYLVSGPDSFYSRVASRQQMSGGRKTRAYLDDPKAIVLAVLRGDLDDPALDELSFA